MNCQQFTQNIDSYLDRDMSPDEAVAMQAHFDSCSACRSLLEKQQELQALLKRIPVPEPTEGFVDRALRAAMQQNQVSSRGRHDDQDPSHVVHHRVGFIKGFSTALAAGLALWFVIGIFPLPQSSPQNTLQQSIAQGITITVQQVQTVKLAFQTVSALDNARITIRLPENVEIVGYEGKRELAWNTDLKRGDNILKLPIKANTLEDGKIVAEIVHNNQIKTIGIDFQVKKPDITMEPLELNVV